MRYAERKRHEFIADHVARNGTINRKDICEKFGVQLCQASKDLAKFQEHHPGLLKYDHRKKFYFVPNFVPTQPAPEPKEDAEEALAALDFIEFKIQQAGIWNAPDTMFKFETIRQHLRGAK